MPPSPLEAVGLTTGYRRGRHTTVVASGLTARLQGGELTCLLGSNGVGKSTLLRTLAALASPLSGTVSVMGRPLQSYSAQELARLVSVVLTERPAGTDLTVREMVAMGRAPYTGRWGRLTAADEGIVDDALALLRLEALADRMVATLSDGERQKVMIAKAVAQQTPVILLDEPTAFLDFPSKVDLLLTLRRLAHDHQKTVLLSTHDVQLALQTSDRVWLLSSTAGLTSGLPEDLALSGAMAEAFATPDFSFDPYTGLFRIVGTVSRHIHVDGRHGECFAMLRKALRRHGIAASRAAESTDRIVIGDKEYVYYASPQAEPKRCGSIEEVVGVFIEK